MKETLSLKNSDKTLAEKDGTTRLLHVIPSKKDTRRNNDSGVFTARSQQPTTDVSYWQEAMPYKAIAQEHM